MGLRKYRVAFFVMTYTSRGTKGTMYIRTLNNEAEIMNTLYSLVQLQISESIDTGLQQAEIIYCYKESYLTSSRRIWQKLNTLKTPKEKGSKRKTLHEILNIQKSQ